MKILRVFAASVVPLLAPALFAQQTPGQIPELETSSAQTLTRADLTRAARENPGDAGALTRYAEYLDRYGDPGTRQAYSRLADLLTTAGNRDRAGIVLRRLIRLDLLAGDNEAAARNIDRYREATGTTLQIGAGTAPAAAMVMVPIPGPISSFSRMAAISGDTRPEDLLPALARNVITNGYQASTGSETLEPTEYLKLIHRYLSQARELDKLAGPDKVIRVESCEAPNVADLLRALGYRMRGGCGAEVVLETVNAPRAFLTTDSGFPLNQLETALRTNGKFVYDYHPATVPVIFGTEYWFGPKEKDKDKKSTGDDSLDFVENLISEPAVCRLYLGFSKLDRQTAEAMRHDIPYARIRIFAHVLDFFGGMFEIRDGKALIPGGTRAAQAWSEVSGVSTDRGSAFFERLLIRDDGWMASLYDALARVDGPVREYLTEPARLKRFYTAIRGRVTTPGPARPVFRSNADMMLLTTRLQIEPGGQPHLPGGLAMWKNLFADHPAGRWDLRLTRQARNWKEADDVLDALFGLCRKAAENEPLRIFMTLSDIDRNRTKPLETATMDRLAREYSAIGPQYSILAESRALSDASILQYLDSIKAIDSIRDGGLRAESAASFQASIGLWQILVRQRVIAENQADAVFASVAACFSKARDGGELFDSVRTAVSKLTGSVPVIGTHERMVALVAGGAAERDAETHDEVVLEINRILEAQRIVPLDLLYQVADHFQTLGKGTKPDTALLNRMAARIAEIPGTRTDISVQERSALGVGYWTDRHIANEHKLNIRQAAQKAAADPEKARDVRGDLMPFLRDTLVALNYAFYAPPGAQILFTNPLFVRNHDFLGPQSSRTWRATELFGSGWPSNGGGRLVGSLAGLPYTLAEAEQNFLVPAKTQALIWTDLVPQMILTATAPRWWNVTPAQLHWVALHLHHGRELLAEAAVSAPVRAQVVDTIARLAAPARTAQVRQLLEAGQAQEAADHVTPSELFALAREFTSRAGRGIEGSCLSAEIRELAGNSPQTVNYPAVSRAFGTPKPTLANSYQPELLNLRTFPTLMGYSSRILAESWESNTLFWAGLADEISLRPAQLNVRIPEWTRELVEQIFASHLEDWPAMLKSLRSVGDSVRTRSRTLAAEQRTEAQVISNR